jgi:hypothetical protein
MPGLGHPQNSATRVGRSRTVVPLLVAILVLLLTGIGLLVYLVAFHTDEDSSSVADPDTTSPSGSGSPPVDVEDRQQAVDAASEAAKVIVTADYRNYDAEIEQATRLMTPSFAAEYVSTSDMIRKEFVQRETVVTVRIATVGLSGMSDNTAQVLVFLDQTSERLSAPGASNPERIVTPFSLTIDLERSNDEWLVNDVHTEAPPRSDEPDPERREVLDASSAIVKAFVNFNYRNPEATFDAVLAGSTGSFREQYQSGMGDLEELGTESQSTLQARVSAAGIVSFEPETATVIVSTEGRVTNEATEFKPEDRNYRIQVTMVRIDGEWLASELQYVNIE